MHELVDMHMHAAFAANPPSFAIELEMKGVSAFANTVTPLEYLRLSPQIDASDVKIGIGMHPWWVGTEEIGELMEALMLFEDGLEETRFVGEVGLDFWPKHEHTRAEQLLAFRHITMLCARKEGCLISMHAVKAERELLDMLEESRCLANCSCILHSYAGPSDQLKRAVDAGCYFSIGDRMLASKRGREYVRIIPADRILLESDLPSSPSNGSSVEDIVRSLEDALRRIADIREEDEAHLRESIANRSLTLLGIS